MGAVLVAAIGAVAAIAASVLAAYFTARNQTARQLREFSNSITLKYAELAGTDLSQAQAFARQFAVAVLVVEGGADGREKVFVPPNVRLTAGRDQANEIVLRSETHTVSRQHVAFRSDDRAVYVEDLGTSIGTYVRRGGEEVSRCGPGTGTRLATGDCVIVGDIEIEFQALGEHR